MAQIETIGSHKLDTMSHPYINTYRCKVKQFHTRELYEGKIGAYLQFTQCIKTAYSLNILLMYRRFFHQFSVHPCTCFSTKIQFGPCPTCKITDEKTSIRQA